MYESHALYDNDSNLCKETALAISGASGGCASTIVVKHKDGAQGLYAPSGALRTARVEQLSGAQAASICILSIGCVWLSL